MILASFETLLDVTPPSFARKFEVAVLMGAFAEAFDVEPPAVGDLTADEALRAFREFTAACMEAALADEATARKYRARLREVALRLGSQVRSMLRPRAASVFRLTQALYRGIGIELRGDSQSCVAPYFPGALEFGPCSFAQRYTSADCWFMSAFDEGFMCGIAGVDAQLSFSCRLTEGATCCRACFREGRTEGEVSSLPAACCESPGGDARQLGFA